MKKQIGELFAERLEDGNFKITSEGVLNPDDFVNPDPEPEVAWNKYFSGWRFSISSTGSDPFSKSKKKFALRPKRQNREWYFTNVVGSKTKAITLGSPGAGNSAVMEYFNWDHNWQGGDTFIDLTNDKLTYKFVDSMGNIRTRKTQALPSIPGGSWRTIPNNGSPIWLMNWTTQSHKMWRPDQSDV